MTQAMIAHPDLPKPIKWHGGKDYLADRIIELMSPHIHYVEPFFGGGSVLLAKNPIGVSEVVNDLNGDLTNFWNTLARPSDFAELARILQATPCSEAIYERAELGISETSVERAANFFILCRQSRAATFKCFTTLAKTRTRRTMNELPSAWWSAIDGLPEVHDRLARVVILNRPAVEVMRTQDGPGTLFYCDPPYVHSTRKATAAYAHEMSTADHTEFLTAARACKGKVVISGYRCEQYDHWLEDWTRHEFKIPNHAAGGDVKREMTECLWTNF